ncbi:MAG: glycosyltransferase, partial [Paeniclostridium sp.]
LYHNYINNKKFEVINITHRDIKDNRVQKKYCDSQQRLNISYLGPTDSYKGIDLLESSLKDLLKKGITNWKLNVFGDDKSNSIDLNNDFYECHGKYSYSDLSLIFKKTDVLVIPSIWKETFGFIGLEALSYGVPVIISSYVGFKDLIQDNLNGLIFNPSEKSLSAVLETVISNREILNKINQNIIRQKFDYTMVNHTKDIIDLYKDVREERV